MSVFGGAPFPGLGFHLNHGGFAGRFPDSHPVFFQTGPSGDRYGPPTFIPVTREEEKRSFKKNTWLVYDRCTSGIYICICIRMYMCVCIYANTYILYVCY